MPKTVLCAAVAVVLLAACGDSGGAGSTTTLAGDRSTTTSLTGPGFTTTSVGATTTIPATTTSAGGSATTTAGATTTTTLGDEPETTTTTAPPAAGPSLVIDGQPVALTYECMGNPLVGLFTHNVVSTGPDPVLLEVWGEETGEVGYILQYGAGGPIFEGFYDGNARDPFATATATVEAGAGGTREITYQVGGGEQCSQVAQLTDPDDDFSGIRFDAVDVCSFGGGSYEAWLNEGAVLELTLEGESSGTMQAVLRDVLFGLEDRTPPSEPGTWERTADGGLAGTAVLHEDGEPGTDPFYLYFALAGALIRTCS